MNTKRVVILAGGLYLALWLFRANHPGEQPA